MLEEILIRVLFQTRRYFSSLLHSPRIMLFYAQSIKMAYVTNVVVKGVNEILTKALKQHPFSEEMNAQCKDLIYHSQVC